MLYRNFLAMETEELLRSHPIDGAVLIGGCDKTTPGLIMGAISMGMPAIYVPPGRCCAATGAARSSAPARTPGSTGRRSARPHHRGRLDRDRGRHRALLRHLHGDGHRRDHDGDHRGARAALPGASSIPAADAAHRACAASPAAALSTWSGGPDAREDFDAAAFDNAISVRMAMGGWTNAIIHVVAMARRAASRST